MIIFERWSRFFGEMRRSVSLVVISRVSIFRADLMIMQKYEKEKDYEILSLLCENPDRGFRMMFDIYHMQLCVYVTQLTNSFQLAEDIVQDFFMVFWENKYYRQIHGNFRSYLYTSVHNAALAALKKKNLLSTEDVTGIAVEMPLEGPCEQEELERKEKELMQKLSLLSPQEFAAVKAVILENKKYAEAALESQVSVSTLKTYLARALKKLRKDYNLSLLFYLY